MVKSIRVFCDIIGYKIEDLKKIISWINDDRKRNKYYYSYKKVKSNGKFRVIAPSCNELKDIQNRLLSKVFRHINFPFYVTGSLPKRSGAINAKMHSGKKYHLQTDLVSFFDFVTHKEVYTALIALGFSADVAYLITQLTTYRGHLPQGTPTSPFLANLVGLTIDRRFVEYCKLHNIVYSRYVDDITFSADIDFKEHVQFLLDEIQDEGYAYSHRKTIYKKGTIQLTGVKTGCNGMSLTDNQIDNLLSLKTTESSRRGIIGHLTYIESISKNFRMSSFKDTFSVLSYPQELWPYMNRSKN